MKTVIRSILAIVIGVALGLGLTALAMVDPPGFGTVSAGPWVARARLGTPEADPYSRALLAMRGEIPLGAVEGLTVTASTDSDQRDLSGACTYLISGTMPAANFWTLTVHDRSDDPVAEPRRISLTSAEALHEEKARISIRLSAAPQPGNWIALRREAGFTLALRLYETHISPSVPVLDKASLPVIRREGCP